MKKVKYFTSTTDIDIMLDNQQRLLEREDTPILNVPGWREGIFNNLVELDEI